MNTDLIQRLFDVIVDRVPSERWRLVLFNGQEEAIFLRTGPAGFETINGSDDEPVERARAGRQPVLDGKLLCHPLVVGNRAAGVICLDRRLSGRPFLRRDLEFVAAASRPIQAILREETERYGGEPARGESPLFGRGCELERIRLMIERVKNADAPVFIGGESGTGKELVARTIHETGRRSEHPFVAVNCGAIPDALMESELFGYSKGAFTGAIRDRPGLIEEARGGTFFLDEIGDLSPGLQSKLLRVLEERRIRRVGENQTRAVGARFISATNKDLEKEVARGAFREDLFYRLKIIAIELPPLRRRREDILPLAASFVAEYCREAGRDVPMFSPATQELLESYDWPGNVRELQNEIRRCVILSGFEEVITEDQLSPRLNPRGESAPERPASFLAARAEFEKRFLRQALDRCRGRRTRTAAEIGLTRQGLFKLIKKHSL